MSESFLGLAFVVLAWWFVMAFFIGIPMSTVVAIAACALGLVHGARKRRPHGNE